MRAQGYDSDMLIDLANELRSASVVLGMWPRHHSNERCSPLRTCREYAQRSLFPPMCLAADQDIGSAPCCHNPLAGGNRHIQRLLGVGCSEICRSHGRLLHALRVSAIATPVYGRDSLLKTIIPIHSGQNGSAPLHHRVHEDAVVPRSNY